ncbi:ORF6N domain-containing protein [Xanthobacter sp. DSM 24535]|uniref:ORF6N domain-containing protein n=1 Tax=Roseixanthobacter psychrophilus TaxID=3119917 RepID=UPI00372990BE
MNSKPLMVSIAGTDVQQVLYKGDPVVTFAMVDEIHKRPDGTAGRTFRENRGRFVEGEDYVELTSDEIRRMSDDGVFPPRSARGTLITRRGYLKLVKPLTDDRAWEVQGEMIDRYFMVEQIASLAPDVLEEIRRTDGIARQLSHKVTEQGKDIATLVQAMTALTAIVSPGVPGVYRPGKSAGEILCAAGFTGAPKNLAKWFGNRLEQAGCRVEGNGHSGMAYYRLFDPDRADAYLKNGGKAAVEMKIAEREGQGRLALSRIAAERYLPQDMPEGTGAIILDGKIVMYDSTDIVLGDGDRAVIIMSNGEVCIDKPEHRGNSGYQGYQFDARAAMSSIREEKVLGRAPIKVRHGSIILGKVTEVRVMRPRPVLVASNPIGA